FRPADRPDRLLSRSYCDRGSRRGWAGNDGQRGNSHYDGGRVRYAFQHYGHESHRMSDTPLVHLENVVLRFGDQTVLDGIDLKVMPGDRLVILGQSGGGKSSMLRLILGILRPAAGSIRYRHIEVQRLRRSKLNLLRSRIGMVYQYSALISSM